MSNPIQIRKPNGNDYVQTMSKRIFDPQWGYSWVYRYEGDSTSLDQLSDRFVVDGWRTDRISDGSGKDTLEIAISDPTQIDQPGDIQEVTEQWIWESEFYTRDSYWNPLISSDSLPTAPAPGSVTIDQMVIIESALKHYRAGEIDSYETQRDKLKSGGSDENSLAEALLYQKMRGGEYDEVDIPSLTRQRTYHARYTQRRQVEMVESFYSSNALIANELIPQIIVDTMPINPTAKAPNTQWGWKERSNTLEIIPQVGKAIEYTRWSFNAWSTLTYNYIDV